MKMKNLQLKKRRKTAFTYGTMFLHRELLQGMKECGESVPAGDLQIRGTFYFG